MSKDRRNKRHGFFEIAEIWQDYRRNKELKERNRIEREKLANQKERARERERKIQEDEKRRAARQREKERRRAEQEREEERRRSEAKRRADEKRRQELEREAIARDKARVQAAVNFCRKIRQNASFRNITESVVSMRESIRVADGRSSLEIPSLKIRTAAEALDADVKDTLAAIKDCRGATPVVSELNKLKTLARRFTELIEITQQYNDAIDYLSGDFRDLKDAIRGVKDELRNPEHDVISVREARERFSSHITVLKTHGRSARLHIKNIRTIQRRCPGIMRLKDRAEEVLHTIEPFLLEYDKRHWFKQLFHSSLTAYVLIGIAALSTILGLWTSTWALLVIALLLAMLGSYTAFNLLAAHRIRRRS